MLKIQKQFGDVPDSEIRKACKKVFGPKTYLRNYYMAMDALAGIPTTRLRSAFGLKDNVIHNILSRICKELENARKTKAGNPRKSNKRPSLRVRKAKSELGDRTRRVVSDAGNKPSGNAVANQRGAVKTARKPDTIGIVLVIIAGIAAGLAFVLLGGGL